MYRNKVRILETALAVSAAATLIAAASLAEKLDRLPGLLPWLAIPLVFGLVSLVFRDPDQVDWYGKMFFAPIVLTFALIPLGFLFQTMLVVYPFVGMICALPFCLVGWLAGAISLWFRNRHTRRWMAAAQR
jgi:hypothetical protein